MVPGSWLSDLLASSFLHKKRGAPCKGFSLVMVVLAFYWIYLHSTNSCLSVSSEGDLLLSPVTTCTPGKASLMLCVPQSWQDRFLFGIKVSHLNNLWFLLKTLLPWKKESWNATTKRSRSLWQTWPKFLITAVTTIPVTPLFTSVQKFSSLSLYRN